MNLTYEIRGNGYVIKADGKDWIVQESYIPFPAATLEESAQLHIADLLDGQNVQPSIPLEEQIQQLQSDLGNVLLESANDKQKITSLEATVGDLLLEMAALKTGGNA